MASEMKVEVIRKETIKPSSLTPHNLRNLSLSFFDQFQPEVYIPLILFYPSTIDEVNIHHHSLFAEKSELLKKSLSKTLTHFYPFAGEFKYNVSISCNDHGAAFCEAHVNCPISKVLEKPDYEILKQFLPTAIESKQTEAGHLLLVQANLFECGGIAIGISISYKVTDASTLSTFIKSWAEIAVGSPDTADHEVLPAEFGVAASLFPAKDFLNSPQSTAEFSKEEKCITRTYVFYASMIAALKAKAASVMVPNPTRVEVVSALIWKCAMEASGLNLGFIKPSIWCQAVNMRKRAGQALTENILGNFVWYFSAMTAESDELDLESLVVKFRKGIEEYNEKYPNGLTEEDVFESIKKSGNLLARDDIETYSCSSWCRFPFYKVDFGWGKPSWVSIRSLGFKNSFIFMDMNDGAGIEVSLTLKEDNMAIFHSNEDLLAYASLL